MTLLHNTATLCKDAYPTEMHAQPAEDLDHNGLWHITHNSKETQDSLNTHQQQTDTCTVVHPYSRTAYSGKMNQQFHAYNRTVYSREDELRFV